MQELKEVTQNFEFIDFASYPSFDVFFLCACLIVNRNSYYHKKNKENLARKEKYLKNY